MSTTSIQETARPQAYTVAEFCEAHRISRGLFYKLVAAGIAPKSMRAGSRRLISIESAAEWRRAREADSGQSV